MKVDHAKFKQGNDNIVADETLESVTYFCLVCSRP